MKNFFAGKKRILCLVLIIIFVIAAGSFGIYEYWYYQKPKFHDLTIELGTNSVSIADFMTEYAKTKKSHFVTDVSEIDLNQVGETELVLAHGKKEETVYLYIEDTTAPTVEFIEKITVPLNYEPDPLDFISSYQDYSEVSIFFAEELPDADSVYTVQSCAVDGMDNVYSYASFEVTAFDEGYGETIYSVYFLNPDAVTMEGLALGDSRDQVLSLYGEGYEEVGSSLVYTKGDTQLSIIIQDDIVISIEYVLIL